MLPSSIDQVIDHTPLTVTPSTLVKTAIANMHQAGRLCALVISEQSPHKLIGLLTEQVIMKWAALDAHQDCPVCTLMTRQYLILQESELNNLPTILTRFSQTEINYLPIINSQEQPVGLLSQRQLSSFLAQTIIQQKERITDLEQGNHSWQQKVQHYQQAENALKRQLQRALLLQQVTDAIRAQFDPQQIFETATTLVGQVLGTSRCIIRTYIVDPAPQLQIVAEYLEPEYTSMIHTVTSVAKNSYEAQVLAQDRTLASTNVNIEPLLKSSVSLLQQAEIKSMISVRTAYQGQPNGMLTAYQCDRFRQWSESEIKLFESIATQIGIALDQARLLEQEKQQREALDQQNLLLQQQIYERQRAEEQLELLFSQSLNGFFFMMLDEPIQWDNTVDKEKVLDYVFTHQRITRVNDAALEQYGATREQFLGLTPKNFYAFNLSYGREIWCQLFDTGRLHIEMQERKFDGTPVWIEGDYTCLYDAQGRIIGQFGVQRDISDRKNLELALKRSETKLSNVLNSANAAIASVRLFSIDQWEVEYRSVGYERIFGFSLEQFETDADLWLSRVVLEDLEHYLAKLFEDVFAGRSGIVEYRFRHGDGTIHWISEVYTPQWDKAANCWIVTTVDTDISDRKRIEETLTRQQEFLRSVIDTPPNLIFAKDWNARFVLANQAVAEIYGTTVEELIGKNDADFNPNLAEVEHFLQDDQEVISTLQPKLIEEFITSASGETYWFQTIKKPITSIDGQSTLVLGVATDVTERKQMEQALRLIVEGTVSKTGQEFFHSLVQHLAELLQVRYAFVTELIKPQRLKARTLAFWKGTEFGENFEYELAGTPCEQVLSGDIIYYKNSIQTYFPHHEHLIDLEVESYFGIPINDSLGNIIGHLKVLDSKPLSQEQISEQILRIFAARAGAELERKQAEDALSSLLTQTQQQSIELEKARDVAESANRAKSEFLASMSHELRTPLNAILGFTQLMSEDTLSNPEHCSYVDIINRSGQHLLELINDVLEMSKIEAGRASLHPTSFDLYHLLDNLQDMLQLKATAKQLTLTFECEPNLPQYITTDESKLRQVLLNLLGNAIKFTHQGTVTLRAKVQESVDVDSSYSATPRSSPSSFPLSFEIADTGIGITPDELQTLFKPFVQTHSGRQSSEGTGLGLAICHKFVRLMGGDITVESQVGQGSSFHFQVQVYPAQASDVPPPQRHQKVIGLVANQPGYRLLVVEDQWENSQLLVKLLEPLGFAVRVASHGREAIALWEQWKPHLIWMDMRMPVMDGYEATRHIRAMESAIISQQPITAELFGTENMRQQMHPTLLAESLQQMGDEEEYQRCARRTMTKIIAITGSAFEENRSEILAIGCDDFIRKPFQTEIIFAKLAEHLGVQFVYAEEDESTDKWQFGVIQASPLRLTNPSLTLSAYSPTLASSVQKMPKEWIARVHQAAVEGRDRQLLELIQQIPATQADLANTLKTLIYHFNFHYIIELTRSTES